MRVPLRIGWLIVFLPCGLLAAEDPADQADSAVSYTRDILPVFQAHCQGCHQPAKPSGDYVMTTFDGLVRGGESELPAVSAGDPDESYLLELIEPTDGQAEMPQGKPPLSEHEIGLVRRWIEQGAIDDSPAESSRNFDAEHPPVYTRPPVITSLDFSPDGQLLAIAGFHEVLLHTASGERLVGRLIGMAERIESVRFSPREASWRYPVAGLGETASCRSGMSSNRTLQLSKSTTFDTIYGGSWSPDGNLIAYGAADNAVRAVSVSSGADILFMAAHDDWVRGTVFSNDGRSVFSASRDMTVKQTDLATQRFVGNVTTHTPGVLRGGMIAIQRHPQRPELLVGGADGAPKLFKMATEAAPASGGNPNQIREYAAMPGRVFAVRFQPDGARFFAGSSLDGAGQVRCYETDSGTVVWERPLPQSSVYALACSPDGGTLAAAGGDGLVRLIDTESGEVQHPFTPVPLEPAADGAEAWFLQAAGEPVPVEPSDAQETDSPEAKSLESLRAEPATIRIDLPTDYVQLVLTGTRAEEGSIDATRSATYHVEGDIGQVTADGLFRPSRAGTGRIVAHAGGQRVVVPVECTAPAEPYVPDFIRDVNPVLSRLGCNAGTCHGAAKGKNGFKLSLRGYDALLDIRALTDDLASRRVNVASPDDSLMLLKATGSGAA